MIENVSDTAHWVAFYRALETERRDALFRDPFARALAGPRGEAIARSMEGGLAGGWPIVVRTRAMDDIIESLAAAGECDTVLNLACGLDARPFRLKLPKELRWIEVDLPAARCSGAKLRCARSSRCRSTWPTPSRAGSCSRA